MELLPEETASVNTVIGILNQFKGNLTLDAIFNSLLLFAVCMALMKVAMAILDRAMSKLRVEPTVHKFTRACVKVLLWIVTIVMVAGYIGVPVNSLVAVLGIIGVAVSLALQGFLGNLAGGIMVMLSKPFSVGNYIEAASVSGTVLEIGLVYTCLKTPDNKTIYIPNGEVSGAKIINYSSQDQRRVDLTFTVDYAEDPVRVKSVIAAVVGAHPKALFTPEPLIRTASLDDNGVGFVVRVWCATDDYWPLYYDLLEQVREALQENGIALTYKHLHVHLLEREKKQ